MDNPRLKEWPVHLPEDLSMKVTVSAMNNGHNDQKCLPEYYTHPLLGIQTGTGSIRFSDDGHLHLEELRGAPGNDMNYPQMAKDVGKIDQG